MYPNLKAEMGKRNISIRKLSVLTGIPYSTLAPKLRGEKPLKFIDAKSIKEALGTAVSLETLFSTIAEE